MKWREVKLTDSQIQLLVSLLYDHREDGSYWGNQKQHYALIEKTHKALDPSGMFWWEDGR